MPYRRLFTAGILLAPLRPLLAQPQPGGGTGKATTLYSTGTNVGITGVISQEDPLQTYTMPANTLRNVGDRIRLRAGGALSSSTDVKLAKIHINTIAGPQLMNISGATAAITHWSVTIDILKTGSNTQTYDTLNTVTNSGGSGGGTLTQTDTSAIQFVVSGQNNTSAVAGSVACQYFTVELLSA